MTRAETTEAETTQGRNDSWPKRPKAKTTRYRVKHIYENAGMFVHKWHNVVGCHLSDAVVHRQYPEIDDICPGFPATLTLLQ